MRRVMTNLKIMNVNNYCYCCSCSVDCCLLRHCQSISPSFLDMVERRGEMVERGWREFGETFGDRRLFGDKVGDMG